MGTTLVNLARMGTSTIGTGPITLTTAIPGYLTFAQAGVADGQTVSYGIRDGANSEASQGVYAAASKTLTRSVINSTNANSPINLTTNAQVYATALAEDINAKVAKAGDTMTGNLTISTASFPLLKWVDTANGANLKRWQAYTLNTTGSWRLAATNDVEDTELGGIILNRAGDLALSSITASTSSTTGALTVAGGVGVGGVLTIGTTNGGVSIKLWNVDNAYNAITLNNDVTASGMIGILGGNAADQNLYYATPAGAGHQFRVNNANVALIGPAGVVVGAPTGGSKGTGTINAVAVYDDNVLLTCFGVEYLKHGKVDLAQWDALSPTGEHKAAHRFVEMVKTFDPRDPEQYIKRMLEDEALPGMPTKIAWQHAEISLGEMHNRLWLATELLASAFVGLHNDYENRLAMLMQRVEALEKRT